MNDPPFIDSTVTGRNYAISSTMRHHLSLFKASLTYSFLQKQPTASKLSTTFLSVSSRTFTPSHRKSLKFIIQLAIINKRKSHFQACLSGFNGEVAKPKGSVYQRICGKKQHVPSHHNTHFILPGPNNTE